MEAIGNNIISDPGMAGWGCNNVKELVKDNKKRGKKGEAPESAEELVKALDALKGRKE